MAKQKKPISKLKKEAQIYFNKFIRERDSMDEKFICISCGKELNVKEINAGHYFPVKQFDYLRFDEDNVHAECRGCNCFNQSHLIMYTWNLYKKLGKLKYFELLAKSRIKKVLRREQIESVIAKYKI